MKPAVVIVLLLLSVSGVIHAKDMPDLDIRPTFRMFLVDGEIKKQDKDLQEKIEELKLVKEPMLTEKDIKAYHWKSHAIEVDAKTIERFKKMIVFGKPDGGDVTTKELWSEGMKPKAFVVVVNGRRAYVGMFYSPISSYLPPHPTIELSFVKHGDDEQENTISVDGGLKAKGQEDIREQDWIKSALKDLGKLAEAGDEKADSAE